MHLADKSCSEMASAPFHTLHSLSPGGKIRFLWGIIFEFSLTIFPFVRATEILFCYLLASLISFILLFKVDSQMKIGCPHNLFIQNVLKGSVGEGTICRLISLIVSPRGEMIPAPISCPGHVICPSRVSSSNRAILPLLSE